MNHSRISVIAATLLCASLLMLPHAQAADKNSNIEVSKRELSKIKSELHFKVVPKDDMVINGDGPWALELTHLKGTTHGRQKYGKEDFKAEDQGFKFLMVKEPNSEQASFTYKVIAFVCTKDKSKCFRDVHQGGFTW